MNGTLEFIARHGYLVLFIWMAAEQLGLPLPAIPVLLAAGAMAGAGRLDLAAVVIVCTIASLLADSLWYEIGRRKGVKVLKFICRVSIEPDSCVRRTEQIFDRYGLRSLVLSKFVPGLATVAPPLAGIFGMRLSHFLLAAGAGAVIYAGTFAGLGYLFTEQLELLAERSLQLGEGLVAILMGALVVYVLAKVWQRRRFLAKLRIARITSEELKERLDGGEAVFIVDLRHIRDVEIDPYHLPGAVLLSPDDLDVRHQEIPRDRDIVLYCT